MYTLDIEESLWLQTMTIASVELQLRKAIAVVNYIFL